MSRTFSPGRLEAFSDGVIAVIITIMVLELKVPEVHGWSGLRDSRVIATLGVYALSFAFVGIYWVNHHLLVHRIKEASPNVLWANLVWMFCLSLIPYFTSYVHDMHMDSFSVMLYAGSLALTGFGFMLLRMTINSRCRVEGTLEETDLKVAAKHWGSLATYVLCIAVAQRWPQAAMIVIAAITLIWVLPTLGVEHCDETVG